jgi:hypothetical protein
MDEVVRVDIVKECPQSVQGLLRSLMPDLMSIAQELGP